MGLEQTPLLLRSWRWDETPEESRAPAETALGLIPRLVLPSYNSCGLYEHLLRHRANRHRLFRWEIMSTALMILAVGIISFSHISFVHKLWLWFVLYPLLPLVVFMASYIRMRHLLIGGDLYHLLITPVTILDIAREYILFLRTPGRQLAFVWNAGMAVIVVFYFHHEALVAIVLVSGFVLVFTRIHLAYVASAAEWGLRIALDRRSIQVLIIHTGVRLLSLAGISAIFLALFFFLVFCLIILISGHLYLLLLLLFPAMLLNLLMKIRINPGYAAIAKLDACAGRMASRIVDFS